MRTALTIWVKNLTKIKRFDFFSEFTNKNDVCFFEKLFCYNFKL